MMKLAGVIMCVVILAPAVVDADDSAPLDGVVAQVGDRVVTFGEILPLAEPLCRQLRGRHQGEELEARVKETVERSVNAMVERLLILDAYKTSGLSVPDEEVDARIEYFIRHQFGNDRGALMQSLASENTTYDAWRNEMRDSIIVSLMRDREVRKKAWIAPDEARKVYDAGIEKYRVPGKVKLRMIAVENGKTEDEIAAKRRQASEIRKKVTAGGDFSSYAREFSVGAKADQGGDWGWVEPAMLRKELAGAVSIVEKGAISEVIETEDQLYILKVEDRQEAGVQPFESVRAAITREIRKEREEQIYRAWIERLKTTVYVKTFDVSKYARAAM